MSLSESKLWMFALDPVHVGTGSAHLSHVDMEIVRDPADRLPMVPGTSIGGPVRAGADRTWKETTGASTLCAGVGTKKDPHCGKCPVCYAFGTARDKSEKKGAVSIHDALLVLFPLYSYTHGPLWIASRERLAPLASSLSLAEAGEEKEVYTSMPGTAMVALGRRVTDSIGGLKIEQGNTAVEPLETILKSKRLAIVSHMLFSRLVNENLEVRTSVAINPLTGTAASGALYRYEALPRASLLLGGMVVDHARWPDFTNKPGWATPWEVVDKGLAPLRLTGLGGMGSRGFGRVLTNRIEEVTP